MCTFPKFKNRTMSRLKRLFILSTMVVLSVLKLSAQTDSKDVSITASGSGTTLENAKQAALRSATEQAFGAFISSKTEMFNDQVVADQMASVSSGNIKSYEVLNQDQLPDGRWGVTLKTIVSVDKLTSFVEAKGIAIEIKGSMFALNIKQQLLNEQGEIKAVAEMVGLLHEPMQMSFDYVIKSSEPKSLDAESKNWEIPLNVTATCNKNIDFCANYFKKTLAALSLSSAEVETYKSLNKQVFEVEVNYQNQKIWYNLRKELSIAAIKSLASNWNFYTRCFAVQSGMDESYGNGEGQIHKFSSDRGYGDSETINFPTSGESAGTFSWNDKRTLSQIEQMTGYAVKPTGAIFKFSNGGYVVYEKDGHGLVVSLFDIGEFTWHKAKTACDELTLNGYSDWRLPSLEELELIYKNLKMAGLGGFQASDRNGRVNFNWSSTDENSEENAFGFNIQYGTANYMLLKGFPRSVRAVRVF